MLLSGITKYVKDCFRKVVNYIFLGGGYDYREALRLLSKVLHENMTQSDIVASSTVVLKDIFKSEWVRYRFADNDPSSLVVVRQPAVSVAIIFQAERIGTLELGPKRSGDSYSACDRQLLETFAFQAAVALEKGRLYQRVEEYNADLERLVEKRTAEIHQLQEDQKQIMVDISHNLQTPLAIIKGELELLSNFSADSEKMHAVRHSINQVSRFIGQLLHLAKLEQSAYEVSVVPVELSALLVEHLDYFEVMAEEQGVRLVSSLPRGKTEVKVWIMGNSRLLSELLANLVTNAIKYRRPGVDSEVLISLFEAEDKVCLTVRDNGVGIALEDLPRVFDRFYRGTRSTSAIGTGLGLAICKRIVEKHQGVIAVESTVGKETIFTVSFPKHDGI